MFRGRVYYMYNDAHVQIIVCKQRALVPKNANILLLPICLNLYIRPYSIVKGTRSFRKQEKTVTAANTATVVEIWGRSTGIKAWWETRANAWGVRLLL
jgi:hypothetical protein